MIDYNQLYKDTISIVTSAANGLYASSNANASLGTMINETYDTLKALAERVESDKKENSGTKATALSRRYN